MKAEKFIRTMAKQPHILSVGYCIYEPFIIDVVAECIFCGCHCKHSVVNTMIEQSTWKDLSNYHWTVCYDCYNKAESEDNMTREKAIMTREKAILILQELWKYERVEYSDYEVRTALDTAIKALEQESMVDKKIGSTPMKIQEFDKLLDSLPRQTYIVSIKYKYDWEAEYIEHNILYEYNGNDDIYETPDWNEGQTDCWVVGYVALDDVKIE